MGVLYYFLQIYFIFVVRGRGGRGGERREGYEKEIEPFVARRIGIQIYILQSPPAVVLSGSVLRTRLPFVPNSDPI